MAKEKTFTLHYRCNFCGSIEEVDGESFMEECPGGKPIKSLQDFVLRVRPRKYHNCDNNKLGIADLVGCVES